MMLWHNMAETIRHNAREGGANPVRRNLPAFGCRVVRVTRPVSLCSVGLAFPGGLWARSRLQHVARLRAKSIIIAIVPGGLQVASSI